MCTARPWPSLWWEDRPKVRLRIEIHENPDCECLQIIEVLAFTDLFREEIAREIGENTRKLLYKRGWRFEDLVWKTARLLLFDSVGMSACISGGIVCQICWKFFIIVIREHLSYTWDNCLHDLCAILWWWIRYPVPATLVQSGKAFVPTGWSAYGSPSNSCLQKGACWA